MWQAGEGRMFDAEPRIEVVAILLEIAPFEDVRTGLRGPA